VVRDRQWFRPWQRYDPSDGLFGFAFLAIDVMAAFTQMLSSGMFERYPRLKCAVLEAGSNWIARCSMGAFIRLRPPALSSWCNASSKTGPPDLRLAQA